MFKKILILFIIANLILILFVPVISMAVYFPSHMEWLDEIQEQEVIDLIGTTDNYIIFYDSIYFFNDNHDFSVVHDEDWGWDSLVSNKEQHYAYVWFEDGSVTSGIIGSNEVFEIDLIETSIWFNSFPLYNNDGSVYRLSKPFVTDTGVVIDFPSYPSSPPYEDFVHLIHNDGEQQTLIYTSNPLYNQTLNYSNGSHRVRFDRSGTNYVAFMERYELDGSSWVVVPWSASYHSVYSDNEDISSDWSIYYSTYDFYFNDGQLFYKSPNAIFNSANDIYSFISDFPNSSFSLSDIDTFLDNNSDLNIYFLYYEHMDLGYTARLYANDGYGFTFSPSTDDLGLTFSSTPVHYLIDSYFDTSYDLTRTIVRGGRNYANLVNLSEVANNPFSTDIPISQFSFLENLQSYLETRFYPTPLSFFIDVYETYFKSWFIDTELDKETYNDDIGSSMGGFLDYLGQSESDIINWNSTFQYGGYVPPNEGYLPPPFEMPDTSLGFLQYFAQQINNFLNTLASLSHTLGHLIMNLSPIFQSFYSFLPPPILSVLLLSVSAGLILRLVGRS